MLFCLLHIPDGMFIWLILGFCLFWNRMPPGPLLPSNVSGMDRQNRMRLKVNRIALVQELKVEHIIGALGRNGIITENDFRKIEAGRTPQDRARILIDILPTKDKELEWYKCFREALLNPEGGNEMKHRYVSLVEFLDNTMIHRPTSQAGKFSDVESRTNKVQYPRYQPLPQISEKRQSETNVLNLDEEWGEKPRELMSVNMELDKMSLSSAGSHRPMMLVKGFFHQWIPTPDNFRWSPFIHCIVLASMYDSDSLVCLFVCWLLFFLNLFVCEDMCVWVGVVVVVVFVHVVPRSFSQVQQKTACLCQSALARSSVLMRWALISVLKNRSFFDMTEDFSTESLEFCDHFFNDEK